MEPYPQLNSDSKEDIAAVVRAISRERENDISDYDNLPNRFMRGRKIARIPTGSADVAAGDRVGDFNYDASYLYLLVNATEWRRITLGAW